MYTRQKKEAHGSLDEKHKAELRRLVMELILVELGEAPWFQGICGRFCQVLGLPSVSCGFT